MQQGDPDLAALNYLSFKKKNTADSTSRIDSGEPHIGGSTLEIKLNDALLVVKLCAGRK